MTAGAESCKNDAMLEIRGNAFRFVLPSGEYWYNRLGTVQALVNGRLVNPDTHKVQKMLRSVKGDGDISPLPEITAAVAVMQ